MTEHNGKVAPAAAPSADIGTGRKAEILDAAAEVFGERGYDGGSMREIASRVGVTEPALYRHFSGKEALFLMLIRVGAGRIRNETLALVAQVRADTLRPQLIALLKNRREAVRFYGPMLRTILPAAAKNERFLEEYRTVMILPALAAITEKAAEIDTALGVADADTTRAGRVRALMSLIVGYFVSSFVLGDDPDEAIVDAAIRVMGWEQPAA